ncbi:GTPase Era [Bernardetia sp. OM2101]|uniref:GTPase Era n=1 Tax=Bernardetia sp. OM2101 TaxID=3344876 RepID=UPI0035D112F1
MKELDLDAILNAGKESENHKAGFVALVGKPNSGKSTLMNTVLGEKLAIVTHKAQTTRHRIMGILNSEDYQIVFSDTPGIISPKYELHEKMMRFVEKSLEDADVILLVTSLDESHDEEDAIQKLRKALEKKKIPVIVLLNKSDLVNQEIIDEKIARWKEVLNPQEILPMSALEGFDVNELLELILKYLPKHPAYYDKEMLTDRPERFFAAEIIREKIFLNYDQEVPYSTEVGVLEFKDTPKMLRIHAEIHVERKSQKGILIGKDGSALKIIGTEARLDMEAFFGKKVFLQLYVRVSEDWRKKANKLNWFGYK